jgi:3-deoxy-D-manno-octulosonic-acid transferase
MLIKYLFLHYSFNMSLVPLFIYNFFLSIYYLAIRVYALFNAKARLWVKGRHNWEQQLSGRLKANEKRIWMHCSSLGEFEQGRPVIEALKKRYPTYKIVITFFSPSGYEARKNYDGADYVFYLPMDSRAHARKFVEAIDPSLAIFVKYEFWYHYLDELKNQNIPVIIISAAFRKNQPFFKWYGGLFRGMLRCFSYFFVQDTESAELLRSIGFDKNVVVAGDTRYDRVATIAGNVMPHPIVEKFKGSGHFLIAGSTWADDENVLQHSLKDIPENWKMVIAPHEIDEQHLQKIQQLFGSASIRYSKLAKGGDHTHKVLIIDNIGMLASLYSYGDIAYVGGGFQKGGIHNILEPAVFGLPVVIGPVYEKFVEAKKMVSLNYTFPVKNSEECEAIIKKLISEENYRYAINKSIKEFMRDNTGAADAIMQQIARENWLPG